MTAEEKNKRSLSASRRAFLGFLGAGWVVTPSPPVSSRGREREEGQKSWRSPCCDTSVARVRLCFPNARGNTKGSGGPPPPRI